MVTTKRAKSVRLLGFSRRHLGRRLGDTLLHRNIVISAVIAGVLTFVSFRLGWIPALTKVQVKDFATGVLAFTALGFGAGTAATVLALAIPKTSLYLAMIVNGPGAPKMRIANGAEGFRAVPEPGADTSGVDYGNGFRSSYGDLVFVFLWTMSTQLTAAVASLLYIAVAGDLAMVDCSHCGRSSWSFAGAIFTISCAIMQMGSLVKAIADYAIQQETFDRQELLDSKRTKD
ncbi:hypothetical protein [Dactylosporangium sp. CA-233914]|uniref:hypothetical protein n=1 Tax=Dactylosporangium sp. CA-233914 TaxID=3239934 RepID=UPI003D89BE7E